MTLNVITKTILIKNIVNSLKDDPEKGVIKLLEMAPKHIKTTEHQKLLAFIKHHYELSHPAKMQIKNLVFNTNTQTLTAFVEKIVDAFSVTPLMLHGFKITSIDKAQSFKNNLSHFALIDLKHLNDPSKEVLQSLKKAGSIYFTTINVTEENYKIVTSKELLHALIRLGARGVFYRMDDIKPDLLVHIDYEISNIRNTLPILAFYMKKDSSTDKSMTFKISETLAGTPYELLLKVSK